MSGNVLLWLFFVAKTEGQSRTLLDVSLLGSVQAACRRAGMFLKNWFLFGPLKNDYTVDSLAF